jgi:uncharacterized protein YdhG (YjbR/CyaY superfamily)
MQSKAITVEDYIQELPEERKTAISELRSCIQTNLPKGFIETMSYGMITYCVPHSTYPAGYHCDPKQALPFISIASQKNAISIYHMGIYSDENILNWFVNEYPKHVKTKLDLGKSCIRFKKPELIPFDLLGELFAKMTVQDWVDKYVDAYVKKA